MPDVSTDPRAIIRAHVLAGDTLARIAARAGVPVRTLRHYLAGHDCRASAVLALLAACGYSVQQDRWEVGDEVEAGDPANLEEYDTGTILEIRETEDERLATVAWLCGGRTEIPTTELRDVVP